MMRSTLLTVAVIAAGLSLMPSAPAVSATKASCRTNHTAAVAAIGRQSTSLQTYVDVPDAEVRIIQGSGLPNCVVVTFSAEAAAPQGQKLMVRAVLDGVETCDPGSVFFARGGEPSAFDTAARTMTFICTGVAPGSHRIKMQYRSDQGGMVSLEYRTLTVHYIK